MSTITGSTPRIPDEFRPLERYIDKLTKASSTLNELGKLTPSEQHKNYWALFKCTSEVREIQHDLVKEVKALEERYAKSGVRIRKALVEMRLLAESIRLETGEAQLVSRLSSDPSRIKDIFLKLFNEETAAAKSQEEKSPSAPPQKPRFQQRAPKGKGDYGTF